MKTQQIERTRFSRKHAEALVPAFDALLAGVMLATVRPLASIANGAPLALPGDAFAITWTLFGALAAAMILIWSHHAGHYDRRRPYGMEVADLLGWTFLLGMLDLGLCLLGGLDPLPSVIVWTLVGIGLPMQRRLLRQRLDRLGLWQRPTVVVGVGYNAEVAARALITEPSLGLSVIAFADPNDERSRGSGPVGVPRMMDLDGELRPVLPLSRLLPEHDSAAAMHVVIAPDPDEMAACVELFEQLAGAERDVDFFPPLGRLPMADARLAKLLGGGLASIRLRERLSTPLARIYKRGFDLVLGLAIGLFTLPLLLTIALAVLIVDGRPIFFAQQRVGMNGRPFPCFKFRTMVADAESRLRALLESDAGARAEWQRDQKLKNDPRISRTGAWLRRTSLDELPQLFNVIRGDMSLIGPRPVVEDELRRYGPAASLYLKIRPGLSGLWQVSGRNDVDYGRRVELDCRYVRNWSPSWDVALLVATIRVVLTRRGAY
ncbi:MAG: exopolysaccharide biosynthesis polyprenyl glycosylphosphotransferase [Geminicoccaceae bacterium]|nr:exopolysaccharide biosynthesis polyprenyl glycosylphosphotransferase [Geminicoccaceae bacterium]